MRQPSPAIIPRDVADTVAARERIHAARQFAGARWPQEVVVENDDGTVSLYAGSVHSGRTIRARRAVDVIREDC